MDTKKISSQSIAIVLNAVILIMELYSCTNSLLSSGFSSFQFYTIDSNLIALFASMFYLLDSFFFKGKIHAVTGCLRYLAVLNLTLTFLIVIFVLCPTMGGLQMLFGGDFIYQHFFCPILAFISFVFFEKEIQMKPFFRYVSYALTLIYAIVLITLNIIGKIVGPYPFLRVYDQPVYMSVIWLASILIFFVIMNKLIYHLAEKRHNACVI